MVPGNGAYNGLRAKLLAALASHQRGQHPTEWNQLGAFINQLQAQRGSGIDAATADRLIAYAYSQPSAKERKEVLDELKAMLAGYLLRL